MSSYLGTVLVTTPLVGTPLLSAILYFSGESQSDNEKWANQIAEFESFENYVKMVIIGTKKISLARNYHS